MLWFGVVCCALVCCAVLWCGVACCVDLHTVVFLPIYFFSFSSILVCFILMSLFDIKRIGCSSYDSNQGFDIRDRSVASVTFDSPNNSKALLLVGEYIDQLRLSLAQEMER